MTSISGIDDEFSIVETEGEDSEDEDEDDEEEGPDQQKPSAIDLLYYAKTGKTIERSSSPYLNIPAPTKGLFPSVAANIYYSGYLANPDAEDDEQQKKNSTKGGSRGNKKKKKSISMRQLMEALAVSKKPTEKANNVASLPNDEGNKDKISNTNTNTNNKSKSFSEKLGKKRESSSNNKAKGIENQSSSMKQNPQNTIPPITSFEHDLSTEDDNESIASSITTPDSLLKARDRANHVVRVFNTTTKVGNKTYHVQTDDNSTVVTEIVEKSQEVVVAKIEDESQEVAIDDVSAQSRHAMQQVEDDKIILSHHKAKQKTSEEDASTAASTQSGSIKLHGSIVHNNIIDDKDKIHVNPATNCVEYSAADDSSNRTKGETMKKSGSFINSVSSIKSRVRSTSPAFINSLVKDKSEIIDDSIRNTSSIKSVTSVPHVNSMPTASPNPKQNKVSAISRVRSMSPGFGKSFSFSSKNDGKDADLDKKSAKNVKDMPSAQVTGAGSMTNSSGAIKETSSFSVPPSSKYDSIISCRSMSPSFGSSNVSSKKKKDLSSSIVAGDNLTMKARPAAGLKGALPPRAPVSVPRSTPLATSKKDNESPTSSVWSNNVAEKQANDGSKTAVKCKQQKGTEVEEQKTLAANSRNEIDGNSTASSKMKEKKKRKKIIVPPKFKSVSKAPPSPHIASSDLDRHEVSSSKASDQMPANVVDSKSFVPDDDKEGQGESQNQGDFAFSRDPSFGVSEADSHSSMSLKHVVTVPVPSTQSNVHQLPSLTEECAGPSAKDNDSKEHLLSESLKEKSRKTKKKVVAAVALKNAAPVNQINVDSIEMENISVLPEVRTPAGKNIWKDDATFATLRSDYSEGTEGQRNRPFLCGIKDDFSLVPDNEDGYMSYGGGMSLEQTKRRSQFSCFDAGEMQRDIADEIKYSFNGMKNSLKSTFRNFVGAFDITSDGGLEVLAAEFSATKEQLNSKHRTLTKEGLSNNHETIKLSASENLVSNKTKDREGASRRKVTIVEEQVLQQQIEQNRSTEKKRKYIEKLRAVSMKQEASQQMVTIVEKQVQQQQVEQDRSTEKKKKYLEKLRAVSMKHL